MINRRNIFVGLGAVAIATVVPEMAMSSPLIWGDRVAVNPPDWKVLYALKQRMRSQQICEVLYHYIENVNDDITRQRIISDLFELGWVSKANCDKTNNPPELIDQNRLKAVLYDFGGNEYEAHIDPEWGVIYVYHSDDGLHFMRYRESSDV